MNANCRCVAFAKRATIGVVILVVALASFVHFQTVSRLHAEVARLRESNAALVRERTDLKFRADAFEVEVVDWRHKNGINDESSQLSPNNQFYGTAFAAGK